VRSDDARDEAAGLGALFRRRGFRDLYIGQAVSAFGDWTVTIALMLGARSRCSTRSGATDAATVATTSGG
jgi:hypothetical protein